MIISPVIPKQTLLSAKFWCHDLRPQTMKFQMQKINFIRQQSNAHRSKYLYQNPEAQTMKLREIARNSAKEKFTSDYGEKKTKVKVLEAAAVALSWVEQSNGAVCEGRRSLMTMEEGMSPATVEEDVGRWSRSQV
ncbi:hypothetical protein K1719_045231 [Acacia pycnantha]|nr:hypothetical protein K1719_045231 [Acacia pycnantha]